MTDLKAATLALITLGLLGIAREAAAVPCTEDQLTELQRPPTSCADATRKFDKVNKCTGGQGLSAAKHQVEINRSRACDPCADAEGKLKKALTDVSTDCQEKLNRLVVSEPLLQCLPGVAHYATNVETVRKQVQACSCADGASAGFEAEPAQNCAQASQARKRAELWLRCPRAPDKARDTLRSAKTREAELCVTPVPPPPARPLRAIFDEIRGELEAVNAKIVGEPRCRVEGGCPELQREQLTLLSLYLQLFGTPIATDEDVAYALRLLSTVGLPPDAFVYVGQCTTDSGSKSPCSPDELKQALALWSAVKDGGLRKRLMTTLKAHPKAQKALSEVLELMERGTNPVLIRNKLREIPPELREELWAEYSERNLRQSAQRSSRMNEKELRQLDVVIGTPEGSSACKPFLNVVLRRIVGTSSIPTPLEVPARDFDARLKQLVAERSARCRVGTATRLVSPTEGKDSTLRACGPVLGLLAHPTGTGSMTARAELRFVLPGGVQQPSVPNREFSDAAADQIDAGETMAEDIWMTYQSSVTSGAAAPPPSPEPTEACGVKLVGGAPGKLPVPKGLGIGLNWNWARDFEINQKGLVAAGLENRRQQVLGELTQGLRLKRNLIGPIRDDAPIVLEISRSTTVRAKAAGAVPKPGGDASTRIDFALRRRHPHQQGERETLLEFAVVVSDALKCHAGTAGERPEERWALAGEIAADRIANYYLSVGVPEPDGVASRLLLPGAEWWSSDDPWKAGAGVAWSVGDLALLGGGVLLVGLSIDERNSFAQGSGSLDSANQLQYWGFGLLGAFVVERVLWGAFGSDGPSQ